MRIALYHAICITFALLITGLEFEYIMYSGIQSGKNLLLYGFCILSIFILANLIFSIVCLYFIIKYRAYSMFCVFLLNSSLNLNSAVHISYILLDNFGNLQLAVEINYYYFAYGALPSLLAVVVQFIFVVKYISQMYRRPSGKVAIHFELNSLDSRSISYLEKYSQSYLGTEISDFFEKQTKIVK